MKESLSLRFLYHTSPGRFLLGFLVRPGFSRFAGKFLESPLSRPMIGYYIRKYHIDMTPFSDGPYRCFNDFFKRRKAIPATASPEAFISPCDAFLTHYPIHEDLQLDIKHSRYSLPQLLQDAALAQRYAGGDCLVFRLEPRHYHRYLFVDSGKISGQKTIPGVLHCVRPIACEAFPVFIQNSREYVIEESDHFGTLLQMEIGALMVGKISNHPLADSVEKYQEKGYFEFGGSTILLLLEKGRVALPQALLDATEEIPVTAGEILGRACL